jgi:hypothetical protein
LPFPLFPYPPLFLLLVLPFATMPVALSLLLSQLVQFAVLAWALRKLAPGKDFPLFLVAAFLSPAASTNVLAGSNAVLVAGLIVGGFAILETSPFLAGALLGAVVFKPQYFFLLPLALLAMQDKKALIGMIVCAAALALASMLVFGPQAWLDWINVYLHPQQVAGVNGTEWGHRWDDSVSTCVALLGAPPALAAAAQALAGLIAVAVVWIAYRRRHPQRLAILLCATLLASPHVSNYDLILLALAAVLYLATLAETSRPLALVLPLLAWIAPLYNPPRLTPAGLITPLVLLGLIWALFRSFSPATAQKPQPAP